MQLPRISRSLPLLLVIISTLTFPFTYASNSVLDAIYVIGLKSCPTRWRKVREWANVKKLNITSISGTEFLNIDVQNPPIPIIGISPYTRVMSGQVGCTHSHILTWRHALRHNYSRIIILEDDMRLKDSLLGRLADILQDADRGSRLHGTRWHYIYLRTFPTQRYFWRRHVWYGELLYALPGWGTAAYIVSTEGIQYLLSRIAFYAYPLDVQIERLQRGRDDNGERFIALDACTQVAGRTPAGCEMDVVEISEEEKGNCSFSASQSGWESFGMDFPSWRDFGRGRGRR